MIQLKQPIVITAIKWTGYNKKTIADFAEIEEGNLSVSNKVLTLPTETVSCLVKPNDYVARGKENKICHYSSEEFTKTFKETNKIKRLFVRMKLI